MKFERWIHCALRGFLHIFPKENRARRSDLISPAAKLAVLVFLTSLHASVSAMTEINNTNWPSTLTLAGSPYTLTSDIIVGVDDPICPGVPQSLTIESGVTVEMGSWEIHAFGGIVSADGATFNGGSGAAIIVYDRLTCSDVYSGEATIQNSTLSSVSLVSRVTGTLNLVNNQITSIDIDDRISLINNSQGSVTNNYIELPITLNNDNYSFSGNTITQGEFEVSDTHADNWTWSARDGITDYRLVSDINVGLESGACPLAAQTLSVESGVIVHLGTHEIAVNGGQFMVNSAELRGDPGAGLYTTTNEICVSPLAGTTSIIDSVVDGIQLRASDTGSLSVSGSQITSANSTDNIELLQSSSGSFNNTIIQVDILLNNDNFVFSGNTISTGAFSVGDVDEDTMSWSVMDGVSTYRLTGNIEIGVAFPTCDGVPRSLTINHGVVVDMGNSDIHVNGGSFTAGGVTFDSDGASAIFTYDQTTCTTTHNGISNISGSTLNGVDIINTDSSVLNLTGSEVYSPNQNSAISLLNSSSGEVSGNYLEAPFSVGTYHFDVYGNVFNIFSGPAIAYSGQAGVDIYQNDFLNTIGNAVENETQFTIDLSDNYWGAATGPSNLGGSGAGYSGLVDIFSWSATVINPGLVLGEPPQIDAVVNDFDGDGDSDALIRNVVSGAWRRFDMQSGSAVSSGNPLIWTGPAYEYRATGDFDGDGDSDVLERNPVSGAWWLFTIENGVVISGANPLLWSGPSWEFRTAADFDGDGDADVLLRNSINGQWRLFIMEAGVAVSSKNPLLWSGPNYAFQGAGDMDGDGDADVLVRNLNTGDWWRFTIENGEVIGGGNPLLWSGTAWEFRTLGDFNNNGIEDVLLRNGVTGQWRRFDMMGGTAVSSGNPLLWTGSAYEFQDAGDYDADGDTDVLVRDPIMGDWWRFEIEAGVVVGGSNPGLWTGLNWEYRGY